MTPEQFCYWLNGFFEIGNPKTINEESVEEIRKHLRKVFNNEVMKNAISVSREYFKSNNINLNPLTLGPPIDFSLYPPRSC